MKRKREEGCVQLCVITWGGGGRQDVCTIYVCVSSGRKREDGCVQLCVITLIILYDEETAGWMCVL